MKKLLVKYVDNTYEILNLKDILAIRFRGNFIAIDETNTTVVCIHDVKEISFFKGDN